MSTNLVAISETRSNFPLWREILFHNSDVPGRRRLDTLSEQLLYRLWEQGAHPSVTGILRHCTWDWERDGEE